jgi:hypothetical protein
MITLNSSLTEAEYQAFVDASPHSMFFHTMPYLKALCSITGAKLEVISAKKNGTTAAVLPLMALENDYGTIINSLPYFGSHGDMLAIPDLSEDAKSVMIDELRRRCQQASAVNIVSNLMAPQIDSFAAALGLQPWDRRIGQVSRLPTFHGPASCLKAILVNCHQKTRNLVRKGLKAGFEIVYGTKDEDWTLLQQHHQVGMQRIGGRFKTEVEFAALRSAGHHKLFVARKNGAFAGGLLVFRYKHWVEYFVPVAVEAFRSEQVLSALIATAMVACASEGAELWNWGGTWESQEGVLHFKRGWGARDIVYEYYGRVNDQKIHSEAPSKLIGMFPHFYVKPFH